MLVHSDETGQNREPREVEFLGFFRAAVYWLNFAQTLCAHFR